MTTLTAPTPTPTIGQIVLFHTPSSDGNQGDVDPFVVAAIITMTPKAWQPGSRTADGSWIPNVDVPQPKPNTVHLHVLWPPLTAAAQAKSPNGWQTDFADIPYGLTNNCWSEA